VPASCSALLHLALIARVHGAGSASTGPSDATWRGFATLGSKPCLRTAHAPAARLCLFGGRVTRMDGSTDREEQWFLPAGADWRTHVNTPAGFGASQAGWLAVAQGRQYRAVESLAAELARAREAAEISKRVCLCDRLVLLLPCLERRSLPPLPLTAVKDARAKRLRVLDVV